MTPQHDIEAAAATMAPVCTPDRGDFRGMAGDRQPIVNRRPNAPALDRRLARAGMTGDEQDDAIATADGLVQAAVDRRPGPVKAVAMQVDDPIGLDRAAAQPAVPTAVERDSRSWPGRLNIRL